MLKLKNVCLAALLFAGATLVTSSSAQAQVFIGPPIVGPRVVARAVIPPVPVVRPVITPVVAAPVPVVRTYGYSSYRPAYVAPRPVVTPLVTPVVAAPVVVTARYRPAYVPFQPVRNAIRFGRW